MRHYDHNVALRQDRFDNEKIQLNYPIDQQIHNNKNVDY
jgi:hypothetical protein